MERTRMSGEDRKKQILQSAINVFVEYGYIGLTTAEIAKAANISEVTLFRHFESKKHIFMALLLIYRNIAKAFIPIFSIVLIIGMSAGIMYFLGIKYTPITATLGALVLGMGTEMTIMMLERYIEERLEGKEKIDAILITVSRIGKATVASGLTTIGGFSVLMASKFVILKDFGLMTVINISLALVSTFIILPTVIILLDRFIISEKSLKEAKAERLRLVTEQK